MGDWHGDELIQLVSHTMPVWQSQMWDDIASLCDIYDSQISSGIIVMQVAVHKSYLEVSLINFSAQTAKPIC